MLARSGWAGARNFLENAFVSLIAEDVMKAYFANLPAKAWVLVTLSAVLITYPVITVVVPELLRAIVPETVRSVLNLL